MPPLSAAICLVHLGVDMLSTIVGVIQWMSQPVMSYPFISADFVCSHGTGSGVPGLGRLQMVLSEADIPYVNQSAYWKVSCTEATYLCVATSDSQACMRRRSQVPV